MYIGKVAKLTGASRKAIRHYEDIGLLSDIERRGSYRLYNGHHVTIIDMIKRAQALGFKLAEIAPMVRLKHQENKFPLALANLAIDEKRAELQRQIDQAKQAHLELGQLKSQLTQLFSTTT